MPRACVLAVIRRLCKRFTRQGDYAETWTPRDRATPPDLFWYGVHGTESLFTVLGTGCQSVKRTTPEGKIEVTVLSVEKRESSARALISREKLRVKGRGFRWILRRLRLDREARL